MVTRKHSGEKDSAEYELRADTDKNILYLDLTGRLNSDEIQDAAEDTIQLAEQLDEGFGIINDIAGLAPPSSDAAKPIKEAQEHLAQTGMGDVVRVISEDTSSVTENAFERRAREAGYEGKTTTSVEEAERLLD